VAAQVTPFAMDTPSQFRSGPPPDLDSQEYRNAYEEGTTPLPHTPLLNKADG
jgi:hypothetical protein